MDAVVLTADMVVDATSFLAASPTSLQALKSASLLKSLPINALLFGGTGTGKSTLARYILPDASCVDARDMDDTLSALESNSAIVLKHIDRSANLSLLLEKIESDKTRVVATATLDRLPLQLEEFFNLSIYLPPLSQRDEDVKLLIEKFIDEAESLFSKKVEKLSIKGDLDLKRNAYSLREQIYSLYLFYGADEILLEQMIQKFIAHHLGSGDDYRELLWLYEVPLIKAGLERYGSQLKLSQVLGLNRNTLRKKILQHNIKV